MAPTRALAVAIVVVALAVAVQAAWEEEDGNSLYFKPSVMDAINADPSASWEAGFNERVHTLSRAAFKGLLGTYRKTPAGALKTKKRRGTLGASLLASLPKNFDSRDKWSQCPTINHIRDQGHCGSCWAFGAVETLSDRFCVRFNESIDLSTEDLLSCCGDQCGDGCDGGWPYKAWQFFVRKGVVTEACQPYFDQEGCKHPGCEPVMPTPACELKCKDNEAWGTSKHFVEEAYRVDEAPEEIMAEIYENGPVEVSFDVYEDFTYYKKGVYRHIAGDVVGGHAVKFIGWGTTEDGVDYWLVANSWNRSWGEDGYFRIVRGTNECGIEEDVVAGLPARRGSVPTPSSALDDTVAII